MCKACPAGFNTYLKGGSVSNGWTACKKEAAQPRLPLSDLVIVAIVAGIVILLLCLLLGIICYTRRANTVESPVAVEMANPYRHSLDVMKQAQWKIKSDELILGDCIGEGANGLIYKATLGTGISAVVAAKEIISTALNPADMEEFEHELIMLTQLNHPLILKLYGFCTKLADETEDGQEHKYIVTELAPNGSLENVIVAAVQVAKVIAATKSKAVHLPFTKIKALEWALQIAGGMNYLHRRGFVHRDIKPQNILLNKGNEALIADLGFVRRPNTHGGGGPSNTRNNNNNSNDLERGALSDMTTMLGTPMYMAPEQVHDYKYSYPVDVWAYGVTLVRLFTLKSPYPTNLNQDRIMAGVASGTMRPVTVKREEVPHVDVLAIIQDCLRLKPEERPTFGTIEERLIVVLKDCREVVGKEEE